VSVAKGTSDYRVAHTLRESRAFSVISDGRFGGDVDLQSQLLSVRTVPSAAALGQAPAMPSAR